MPTKLSKSANNLARPDGGNGRATRASDSRFDRRRGEILTAAADVFCEKGYEGASMRDLARCSSMSLAGLYYYFESKEKLLYLIQRRTFSTVLDRLRERLTEATGPEDAVRMMIGNHMEYFVANMTAMKVLSHEADTLKKDYGQEIQAIKREYYRICVGLLEELRKARLGKDAPPPRKNEHRIPVLSLFGMMNWIYTWYNPQIDPDSEELAEQMSDMFLRGVLGERTTRKARKGRAANEF